MSELEQLKRENEHLQARVACLTQALKLTLGHIPRDLAGSTYWSDDDGCYVEHEWHKRVVAVLCAPSESVGELTGEAG